jgi:hypothetical protein
VGTTTSKLLLYKPDLEDVVNAEQDISNNFLTIDKYIGFYVCTSLTRPDPYEGLKIYEEDTGLLYIYALGLWTIFVDVPPVSVSGGRKALVKSTTDGNQLTTTQASGTLTATFASETNRRYWVEIAFLMSQTGANAAEGKWFLKWAAGNSVTTAGTSITGTRHVCVTATEGAEGGPLGWCYGIFEFIPNISGNVTVGLFGASASSDYTVYRYVESPDYSVSRMIVRDVGGSF